MLTDDLKDWLGPVNLTAEQFDRLHAEAQRIAERYPDPDEQPEREAALSATAQYLLGDVTAEDANRALIEARSRERAAYVAALQVAVLLVGDGAQKAAAARAVGIDRMRVLKALGER